MNAIKKFWQWITGTPQRIVYAPSGLLVKCGRIEIVGPPEATGGPFVGHGVTIKIDGEEVKGLVKADLRLAVDEVVRLELEVMP